MKPIDQSIRTKAITPDSFIVSAPAGSGKTYLLTRRILNLLTTVSHPSHVVAITFTKKAAGEMQHRLESLLKDGSEPLAKAVLAHSEQQGWDILNHLDSLSIMTIDAFCAWLLKHSEKGIVPTISQNPHWLYQQVIFTHYQKNDWSEAQHSLLKAFHGNYDQLETLLINLLATRDQWQSSLKHQDLAKNCIEGIQHIRDDLEKKLVAGLLPIQPVISEILSLHATIAKNVNKPILYHLNNLLHLNELFLTKSGDPRKTLNKNQGIYPKTTVDSHTHQLQQTFKQQYQLVQDFLEESNLLSDLDEVRYLPILQLTEEQAFLSSLSILLDELLTSLEETFIEHEHVDFTYISLKAINALQIDATLQKFCQHSIHHLLIDEFQDTSITQHQLLYHLIQQWPQNDQRTLFVVGDPMQSIYRFRQADVGLFIKLQSEPINHIQPEPLALQCNFRSSSQLIAQINQLFPEIFPLDNNPFLSSIQYTPAVATQKASTHDGVYMHIERSPEMISQAQHVLAHILELSSQYPNDSIAILVQARSHLKNIIPLLEKNNLLFNALDIYPTSQLSSIQDLSALMGMLIDPYDMLSVHTVLRSPLCGLTLDTLLGLPKTHLLDILNHSTDDPYLHNFQQACKISLRNDMNPVQQVWTIWQSLSGSQRYPKEQKTAITTWFETVENYYQEGLPLHRESLLQRFSQSYNSQLHPNAKINLLTAHKSKGLEYDHVIIPHMEKRKPSASTPLFFAETSYQTIIQPSFTGNEQNNTYFKRLNQKRDDYENMRLFYVACTRAKKTLHLFAHFEDKPPSRTWLNMIWPLIQQHQFPISEKTTVAEEQSIDHTPTLVRSLSFNPSIKVSLTTSEENQHTKIGTALHYLMQILHSPQSKLKWERYLYQFTPEEQIELNRARTTVLENTCHGKGLWVTQSYAWERNEYTLQYQGEHLILDRVFIDEDTLWIIDYKFPSTTNKDLLIEQYQPQLTRYYLALKHHKPNMAIQTALYLPYLDVFIPITITEDNIINV